jgi:hypothetical protein
MGKVIDSNSPVFIISSERSGSTLLRYIVDTHPEMTSPGQLYLGELCHHLYRAIERTIGAVSGITDEEGKKRMVYDEVKRIVLEFMDRYTTTKNKRIWCEKTPVNLGYMDTIKGVFPEAKYICLYRNAMDVVHSCLENWKWGFVPQHFPYIHQYPDNFVSAMVKRWIDNTETLLAFENDNPSQCYRIKYESLAQDPPANLEPMFDFLGVQWDVSILEAVFSTWHDEGDGDLKVKYSTQIYMNSIGKGSKINLSHIPEPLLKEMNAQLEKLNYPIIGQDWDTAPSPYLSQSAALPKRSVVESIEEIFLDYLPHRLNQFKSNLNDNKILCKVVVKGKEEGFWLIDSTDPGNQVRICDRDANSECVLTIEGNDLIDIINGNLNPAEAQMQGKIHLAGDGTQAAQLGRLLFMAK